MGVCDDIRGNAGCGLFPDFQADDEGHLACSQSWAVLHSDWRGKMMEHVCFPQYVLGTGEYLCRDCDAEVPMTQEQWQKIVREAIANA